MTATRLMAVVGDDRKIGALDETHLDRMTLGDRRLEREVLELFLRQTTIMLDRIVNAPPPLAAAAAHTLKGSARGIGAWRVARAAELLEQAAEEDGGEEPDAEGHADHRAERPARLAPEIAQAIGEHARPAAVAPGRPPAGGRRAG